jgi:hypothetical protein
VGQGGKDGDIVDVTGPGVATQAFMARVVVPAPAPEDPRVAVVRMLADAIVAAVAAGDLVGAAAATEGLARMLERLESVGTGGETASVRRLR